MTQPVRVAVNGFGVIGKRVSDASLAVRRRFLPARESVGVAVG